MNYLSNTSFQSMVVAIVGCTQSGKTYYLYHKFITPRLNKKSRVLLVVGDDAEWQKVPEIKSSEISTFTGIAKIFYEKGLLLDLSSYENGLLVFDDARNYFTNDKLDEEIRSLMTRLRQRKVDVVCVYHGLSQVHKMLWTFLIHLVLFGTTDNATERKYVIPKFELVNNQREIVNREKQEFDRQGDKTKPRPYKIIYLR